MTQEIFTKEIINLSIPLITKYITNLEEYSQDISSLSKKLFEENPNKLLSLLNNLTISYNESDCIMIADILFDAACVPYSINGIHYDFPPDAIRRKPALYFYELAIDNNSGIGYSKAAGLYLNGEGDIQIDEQKSMEYHYKAIELGCISSMNYFEYEKSKLDKLEANGCIYALLLLSIYYTKNNFFFAKSKKYAILFKNNASEKQIIDGLKYLNEKLSTENLNKLLHCKNHAKKIQKIISIINKSPT